MISRIIKVSVRVIRLSLRLRLITLTSTFIILDITKTSSNNCLKLQQFAKKRFPNHESKKKLMLELFSPHKTWFIKHTQSYHIVETAYEDDSHFITQLLVITPVIYIHREINICVYSDLCWEKQLQKKYWTMPKYKMMQYKLQGGYWPWI